MRVSPPITSKYHGCFIPLLRIFQFYLEAEALDSFVNPDRHSYFPSCQRKACCFPHRFKHYTLQNDDFLGESFTILWLISSGGFLNWGVEGVGFKWHVVLRCAWTISCHYQMHSQTQTLVVIHKAHPHRRLCWFLKCLCLQCMHRTPKKY